MTYDDFLAKAKGSVARPDIAYRGLEKAHKLYLADGTAAFLTLSDLDLDTDGKSSAGIRYESTHQSRTSIDPAGEWCDSNLIPFYVLPIGWPVGLCELGTLATILYGGRHVHAIYADAGPRVKYGEASLAVHRALGFERVKDGRIVDVGIGGGVTTLIHLGQTANYPCTFAEIQAAGENAFRKWI